MTNKTFGIGKAASRLGVAPSTLRYYDKEGLLPFVERSESGIRCFKESDFEWLRVIECLKKTGMSIKSIKSFIEMAMRGDETIDDRLELIIRQTKDVRDKISELEQTLRLLEYKRWYYESASRMGSTAAVRSLPEDEIPENLRDVRVALLGKN